MLFETTSDKRATQIIMQRKLKIGAYLVGVNSCEVTRDGVSQPIEPMVLKVIVALYNAHPRYLKVEELMAECWQGKVVSDVTVRTVIAKARKSLKREQSDPDIIISKPRVGYKFDIPPAANGQAARRAKVRWFAGLPLIGLACILLLIRLNSSDVMNQPSHPSTPSELELVVTPDAEITGFSVSSDRRYYAFSSRETTTDHLSLNIFDTTSETTVKVELPINNVVATSFIPGTYDLLVADLSYTQSKLLMVESVDMAAAGSLAYNTVLDGLTTIGAISGYSPEQAFIIVSDQTSLQPTAVAVNLVTGEISSIRSTPKSLALDRALAVNPGTDKLAILSQRDKQSEISIYSVQSGKFIESIKSDVELTGVSWGERDALLAEGYALYQYNRTSNAFERMYQDFKNPVVYVDAENLFVTAGIDTGNSNYLHQVNTRTGVKSLVHLRKPVINAYFHSDNSYLLLALTQDALHLYRLEHGEYKKLGHEFGRSAEITARNSFNSDEFIIQDNGIVHLYNAEMNQLTQLNTTGTLLQSATFDQSGDRVLWTQRRYGEWVLGATDRAFNEEILKRGIASVVSFSDRYMVLNTANEVVILDGQFNQVSIESPSVAQQNVDTATRTLSLRLTEGSVSSSTFLLHSPYLSPSQSHIVNLHKVSSESAIHRRVVNPASL